MDGLMKRMDALQTEIDAANGWELERQLERATEALRCPPGAGAWSLILENLPGQCVMGAGAAAGARGRGATLPARCLHNHMIHQTSLRC